MPAIGWITSVPNFITFQQAAKNAKLLRYWCFLDFLDPCSGFSDPTRWYKQRFDRSEFQYIFCCRQVGLQKSLRTVATPIPSHRHFRLKKKKRHWEASLNWSTGSDFRALLHCRTIWFLWCVTVWTHKWWIARRWIVVGARLRHVCHAKTNSDNTYTIRSFEHNLGLA